MGNRLVTCLMASHDSLRAGGVARAWWRLLSLTAVSSYYCDIVIIIVIIIIVVVVIVYCDHS